MSWWDNPKGGVVRKWLHRLWVLSFNQNDALSRVVWWSRYYRPYRYNTKGRIHLGGILPFLFLCAIIWFIVAPMIDIVRRIF